MHSIFYICQILILPALSILILVCQQQQQPLALIQFANISFFFSNYCISWWSFSNSIHGCVQLLQRGRYSGEGSKGAFAFQPKYKSAHPHLIITLEQLSGQAMLKTFRFLILEIQNLSGLALSVATCHQCNWLWIGSFLWWMFLRQIFYRCASPFSCKNRVGGKTAAPAVSAFNPSLLN